MIAPIKTKDLVYVKIRLIVSPIHQEFRGFRIVVAHPNLDGITTKTGEKRPSFNKPYLICSTGDLPRITPQVYHRFIAEMQKQGYKRFELWSDLEPRPFFANSVKGMP